MKPETISLLCNPFNHSPLRLVSERKPDGRAWKWLVDENSGQRFPVQNGIPVFVNGQFVTGANQKYQKLYDRIARWYDISERIGARLMAREVDRMDCLEFIAWVISRIPIRCQVTVRYYGLYACAHRGKIRTASPGQVALGMIEEKLQPNFPHFSPGTQAQGLLSVLFSSS